MQADLCLPSSHHALLDKVGVATFLFDGRGRGRGRETALIGGTHGADDR